MRCKLVFKKPLAEKLIKLGHPLIGVFLNNNRKNYIVYKFIETERFVKDFERIKEELYPYKKKNK
ncbi:MAG: hypothetical protein HUJ68_14145 [Clostridia bacterium]|nr:hypothetical protein [Clostridia bacterium]